MQWSQNIRDLRRGVKVTTQIVKAKLDGGTIPKPAPSAEPARLVEFADFGANPGKLRMLACLPGDGAAPDDLAGRPLVILLHGCGQDAARFARDSGWADLASRQRFPLILPEQAEANNPGRCFQWFQPSETARDAGEAGSIAAMARTAIRRFGSDPRRIFILGLSAGGAMAAAMLAAYPDVFAAGASLAGLPVGSARSGIQAILRMASAGPDHEPQAWLAQLRAAAPAGFAGPWPRLSVWQGQTDMTVAPDNAPLLAAQWRALHGLTDMESDEQVREGVHHRMWPNRRRCQVELWSLPQLPHAYPVGSRPGEPEHFVAPAPVDATVEIARFFGLV